MQDLEKGFFSIFLQFHSSQGKVRRGCSTERRSPYRFNLKMWVWADQWLMKYMKRLESPLVCEVRSIIYTNSGFLFHFVRTAHAACFFFALVKWVVVSLCSAFWGIKICEPKNYNHPNQVLCTVSAVAKGSPGFSSFSHRRLTCWTLWQKHRL